MEKTDEKLESIVDRAVSLLESTTAKLKEISSLKNETEDKWRFLELKGAIYRLASEVSEWSVEKFSTAFSWLPQHESLLEGMKPVRIESPWSIVLKYPYGDVSTVEKTSVADLHHFIGTPKPGDYLCCKTPQKVFRCLVLRVLSESFLRVLYIDTYEVYVVTKFDLYHLPMDSVDLFPLCLHCSLLEEDQAIQQLWVPRVQDVFKDVILECSLSVEILQLCEDIPPKYLVNLMATNSKGKRVNLTEWLSQGLIPALKRIGPVWRDDVLNRIDEKLLDPFYSTNHALANSEEDDQLSLHSSQLSLSALCSSFDKWLNITPDEQNRNRKKKLEALGMSLGPPEDNSGSSIAIPETYIMKRVNLPLVGERVSIVITHVLTPLSFYAKFDNCKYSDPDGFKALMKRMNTSSGIRMRKPLKQPKVGLVVAYFGKSGVWQRGIISQTRRETSTLFDADFGHVEIVHTDRLKSLLPQEENFPFQAVLMFLHNIYIANGKNDEAALVFDRLVTQDKDLKIMVRKVDFVNTTLEVELLNSNNFNVNDELVESGFFVRSGKRK